MTTTASQLAKISEADARAVLTNVSEDTWSGVILRRARLGGWLGIHIRAYRKDGKALKVVEGVTKPDGFGWPDWVLIHPLRGLLVVVELKTNSGPTTDYQQRWLAAWQAALGAHGNAWVGVWRPRDIDAVDAVLLRYEMPGNSTAHLEVNTEKIALISPSNSATRSRKMAASDKRISGPRTALTAGGLVTKEAIPQ